MSEYSNEFLSGYKAAVDAENITGDRASVLTFGLIGGFILGIIALWWGGPRGRSFKAKDLEVIDPDADAKRADSEAAAVAAAESDSAGNHSDAATPPAVAVEPAPKPSDLEEQAG